MLLLDILKGKAKLRKFQPTIGDGDPLWDNGWRGGVKKIGPFKFLLWTRDDISDYKYSVKDVALKFNVTEETVRRWCRNEKIKFLKMPGIKGQFMFSEDDIKNFISKRKSDRFSL
jgi:excisionase family DNA binding protein